MAVKENIGYSRSKAYVVKKLEREIFETGSGSSHE